MVHMTIPWKVKECLPSGLPKSIAWTPNLQNIINSSTRGWKKVSMLFTLTFSLLEISNATIMINHLLSTTMVGCKLECKKVMGTIGTIFYEDGLNPFVDMFNLKFHGSLLRDWYIHFNLGIMGIWHKIFFGTYV
jgi:hypothetical protein